jgi:hypothetical protein
MGLRIRFVTKLQFLFLGGSSKGEVISHEPWFGSYSGMLTTTTDNGIRENGIV